MNTPGKLDTPALARLALDYGQWLAAEVGCQVECVPRSSTQFMTDAESIVHDSVCGASSRPFSQDPRSKVKTSFGLLLASSDPFALQVVGGLEVLVLEK